MVSSDVRNIPFEPGGVLAILERPLSEISYAEVPIAIVRIGTRYELRLPRELALVAKKRLYLERCAKRMAPDWTILDHTELIAYLFQATVPTFEERLG